MRKIFKYAIPVKDEFTLQLPERSVVLCVQVQGAVGGLPHIWVECDPTRPLQPRGFRLFGTGHPISESVGEIRYVGTFQMDDGEFIGHLYERTPWS